MGLRTSPNSSGLARAGSGPLVPSKLICCWSSLLTIREAASQPQGLSQAEGKGGVTLGIIGKAQGTHEAVLMRGAQALALNHPQFYAFSKGICSSPLLVIRQETCRAVGRPHNAVSHNNYPPQTLRHWHGSLEHTTCVTVGVTLHHAELPRAGQRPHLTHFIWSESVCVTENGSCLSLCSGASGTREEQVTYR